MQGGAARSSAPAALAGLRRGGPRIEDDHRPLIRAGVPTIDLIDFDYDPWHTAEDTVDKCSAESLGKVGKLMVSWLLQPSPTKAKWLLRMF